MAIKFLLDEHVSPEYRVQLQRRDPDIVVGVIGDPAAPPLGTLDPIIPSWCEQNAFALVTNNRKTMPDHLADHLRAGHHVPGIFILNPDLTFGELLDELELVAIASREGEHRDQITFLPVH